MKQVDEYLVMKKEIIGCKKMYSRGEYYWENGRKMHYFPALTNYVADNYGNYPKNFKAIYHM